MPVRGKNFSLLWNVRLVCVREWLRIQESNLYRDGIFRLLSRWEQVHSCAAGLCSKLVITRQSINFSKYQLNAQFFYSSTICMLHYAPQHVSSSSLLIIRRTNCITTASGIVTLCKQPYSMQVESGLSPLSTRILYAAYRGWRYQRLWWYNWSSWWWAACCSKHLEECSVTYVLMKIKRILQ